MAAGDDAAALDEAIADGVRILVGRSPEIAPSSRRAKHLRSTGFSEPPRRAHSYVIDAVGGGFGVVPYDRRGKPIRLHALGSATYPSVDAARAAIRSYEAHEARSRTRDE